MVWRGRIGLRHPQEAGRVVVSLEGAQAGAVQVVGEQAGDGEDVAATVTLVPGAAVAVVAAAKAALPFVEGAARREVAFAEGVAPAVRGEDDGTGTVIAPMVREAREALPFRGAVVEDAREAWAVSAPREKEAPPPFVPAMVPAVVARDVLLPAEEPKLALAAPAPGLPEAPPMIGPQATPEMVVAKPESASAEAAPQPALKAEPAPKPAAPPAEPEIDLETYTVERCATIAVSIACRPADTAKTLEEHELSAKRWDKVKNHWLEAIRKELAKGKNALLRRYDAAYVAQVEVERGPIGVEEYARLAVAAERGATGEAVAEMGLPSGAPIRIERVWMERMALDAAFGERVRAAVEEQRAA